MAIVPGFLGENEARSSLRAERIGRIAFSNGTLAPSPGTRRSHYPPKTMEYPELAWKRPACDGKARGASRRLATDSAALVQRRLWLYRLTEFSPPRTRAAPRNARKAGR